MRSKTTMLSIFLLFASLFSTAQDSLNFISGADASFMKKKALTVVKSFNELLNILAGKEQNFIDEMTNNSYNTNNKSRIFLDSSIRINEDIDPSSTTNIAVLITVSRYLNTFYLEYEKSDDPSSVEMNILKVSLPKKAFDADTAYPFVKVFFNSHFHNKNKHQPNDEYRTTNRYADVRMIKDKEAWLGYIQRIGFFVSEDTLQNFTTDDILLSSPEDLNDSSFNAAEQKSARDQFEKEGLKKKQEKREYDSLITRGDNFLEKDDFKQAIDYYTMAKQKIPGLPTADLRIKQAKNKRDDANILKKNEAETFAFNAKKEEIRRNYREAIKWYKAASKAYPEQAISFDQKIDELNKKFDVIADLEEKYNAGLDYKVVLEDYEKAIKKNKENSDLYLGRARCYDKLNYLDKAIKDCDNALEKDPRNFPALMLRASLKSESTNANELLEGISDYGKCANIYEYDSSIYELKSALRLKVKPGDFNEVIKDIDEGIQVNPKWANLHYQKGVLLLKKADYQNAKTAFTDAIANKAVYPTAYFQRGIAQLQLNNTDDAAADFKKAMDYNLDTTYQKQINAFADNFYKESNRTFNESKTDSALWYINKAIILYPLSDYFFKKGIYQIKANKYADAVNSLTTCTGSDPKNANAFYYLGVAYVGQKDLLAASKQYTQAIILNEKLLLARKELGDVYFMMEDNSKAIDSYQGFITTLNNFTKAPEAGLAYQVYNSLGKSYFITDNNDNKALINFQEAIKLKKDFAEASFNEGVFYYRNNDINKAIKSFENAVSLDSKNTGYNKKLAVAYVNRGADADLIKAIDCFNIALTATNHSDVWFPMATCNLKLQKYSEALDCYHHASAEGMEAVYKTFNYEIGYTYLNLGKVDSAMIFLQKTYSEDSTNDKNTLALAIALWQKGNIDESVRLFVKIIQAGKISKKEIKNERLMANIKNDEKLKPLLK